MEKRYNDSQVKAIGHFNGPCLTLAGPGSEDPLLKSDGKRFVSGHIWNIPRRLF